MYEATARKLVHFPQDTELFLYLRLETEGRAPLLADEDVSLTAETALTAEARMQRCRVRAVNSTESHLHLVAQFPASLSPKSLAGVLRDASAVAVARFLSLERQRRFQPDDVWSKLSLMKTLSSGDVPAIINFVCHHVGRTPATQLVWHDFLREATATYGEE